MRQPIVWWKVRDEARLWLAFLFALPVLLMVIWTTLGFVFGF